MSWQALLAAAQRCKMGLGEMLQPGLLEFCCAELGVSRLGFQPGLLGFLVIPGALASGKR